MATIQQSAGNFPSPVFQIMGLILPYTTLVWQSGLSNLSILGGTTDLYTIPAGYVGISNPLDAYNTGILSTGIRIMRKISGTYYGMSGSQTVNAGANAVINSGNQHALSAGQALAVSSSGLTTVNIFWSVILVPTTTGLASTTFTAFTGGNDTIYTVPANTRAILMRPTTSINPQLEISNDSGAARTRIIYMVPSGQAVGNNYKVNTASNNNLIVASVAKQTYLNAGDFIVISSSSSASAQAATITYLEMPV